MAPIHDLYNTDSIWYNLIIYNIGIDTDLHNSGNINRVNHYTAGVSTWEQSEHWFWTFYPYTRYSGHSGIGEVFDFC